MIWYICLELPLNVSHLTRDKKYDKPFLSLNYNYTVMRYIIFYITIGLLSACNPYNKPIHTA